VDQKQRDLAQIQAQTNEQKNQIMRASRDMHKKRDEYRKKSNMTANEESVEELHITLHEKRRRNEVFLNLLKEYNEENPQIQHSIVETLEELGLQLNISRPSSASSTDSRRSTPGKSRPQSQNRSISRGDEVKMNVQSITLDSKSSTIAPSPSNTRLPPVQNRRPPSGKSSSAKVVDFTI